MECLRNQLGYLEVESVGSERSRLDGNELCIVDGLERLNWLNRWLLVRFCKNQKFGLLVTSHRRLAGIPVVATLTPSLATFCDVVNHLLAEYQNGDGVSNPLDAATITRAFEFADGNLRNALMILYDDFHKLQLRRKLTMVG